MPVNIGEKLKILRVILNITQTELSEIINSPQTNISRIEKNILAPTDEFIDALCVTLAVNEKYFYKENQLPFTPQGIKVFIEKNSHLFNNINVNNYSNLNDFQKTLYNNAKKKITKVQIDDVLENSKTLEVAIYKNIESKKLNKLSDFVLIPRYNVETSAGNGTLVPFEEIIEQLAFSVNWMRHRGLPTKSLVSITATGDSMSPTINHKDFLVVDTSQNRINIDDIYVIRINDSLRVKRIQSMSKGGIVIKSDNKNYQDEVLTNAEFTDISVVGRVVFICKEN